MKNILITLFTFSPLLANAEKFNCVLADKALSKSPLVSLEYKKDSSSYTAIFYKNSSSYDKLTTLELRDESEDVLLLATSKNPKVNIRFYLDETDTLGFMDGSIESPNMNGDLKCVRSDY